MPTAFKPAHSSPQTHLYALVGYLSRCGPVDCISKVTHLQDTFYEGPGAALSLAIQPLGQNTIPLRDEKPQSVCPLGPSTPEAQKGLPCY